MTTIVQHGTHVTCAPAPTPPNAQPRLRRHSHERARQLYSSYRDPNIVTIVHALPLQLDTFISTTAPAKDVNKDIMDAFVFSVGRYTGGEDELREFHCLAGSVPLGERWLHKYLGDLDGMSYS
ncbi:hypothetical protein HD554DRAFT_2101469 [Boletus coccyginus]|nr:hypothetical protein HD554DRAFT_2101469 [Boletus coccyginus]